MNLLDRKEGDVAMLEPGERLCNFGATGRAVELALHVLTLSIGQNRTIGSGFFIMGRKVLTLTLKF